MTGDVSLAKFKNQNPGEITNPLIDNIMNILRGTTSFALENNYGKTSGAFVLSTTGAIIGLMMGIIRAGRLILSVLFGRS